MATERSKENGAKLPHEKTGDAWRKGERNKEERETLKPAVRKKSRTGNSSSTTTKRETTTSETAAEPAAKTTTCETEKMGKLRIAPNVKLRGWRSQSHSNVRLADPLQQGATTQSGKQQPHPKFPANATRASARKHSSKRQIPLTKISAGRTATDKATHPHGRRATTQLSPEPLHANATTE